MLNAIVANQLVDFKAEVDAVIANGQKKEVAIINVLRRLIAESKNVIFEGNGYSEEWVAEASKRGLSNIKTTPEALAGYVSDKALAVFERFDILSHREAEARYEVMLEQYVKKLQIEGRVLAELVSSYVVPAALASQAKLIETARGLKELGLQDASFDGTVATIKQIGSHLHIIRTQAEAMTDARKQANLISNMPERALTYCNVVKPFFDDIRYHTDKLELLIDNDFWPLVKYREMLFAN